MHYEQLKEKVRTRLIDLVERDPAVWDHGVDRALISSQLEAVLITSRSDARSLPLTTEEQERLVTELAHEMVGAGPLQPLLKDPTVSEVMVNGPFQVYVERKGRLEPTTVTFRDANHLMLIVERLLDSVGVSVTTTEPCVDASLPDGSRINVVIPPIVVDGPVVTIRKKIPQWSMDQFVSLGSLSAEAAQFLAGCVKARVNLVISGGTSSGKTTLVSLLSAFMSDEERIITIENVAELELPNHSHWIRMVARSPNMEGRGEVSLRLLVRNALRMRPDRIILGEARSGEALDVVQAMHTGHDGVVTVIHANAPQAALERLQTLMLMSGLDLPPQACQMQIATAVDLVIHLARHADGSRRVVSIAHVLGSSSGGFQLEEVFAFEIKGFRPNGTLEGGLRYTGVRPKFLQKFQLNNVPIPSWISKG